MTITRHYNEQTRAGSEGESDNRRRCGRDGLLPLGLLQGQNHPETASQADPASW